MLSYVQTRCIANLLLDDQRAGIRQPGTCPAPFPSQLDVEPAPCRRIIVRDHYWCQEGVVVLTDKSVFSFTVYRDRENRHLTFMTVYRGDGKGVHLYQFPQ